MARAENGDRDDARESPRASVPGDTREVATRSSRQKLRDPKEQIKISTTSPAEILRHNISDEQLDALTRDSGDGLSEMFWGFVSAAVAALPSAGEATWNAFFAIPKVPLSILHLIEIIIVSGAVACAIVVKIISRGRRDRVKELADKIQIGRAHV